MYEFHLILVLFFFRPLGSSRSSSDVVDLAPPSPYQKSRSSVISPKHSPKRVTEEQPYVTNDARIINLGNASPNHMHRSKITANPVPQTSPIRTSSCESPKPVKRRTPPRTLATQSSYESTVSLSATSPTPATLPEPPSRNSSSKYAVKYYSAQGYGDNHNKVTSTTLPLNRFFVLNILCTFTMFSK